MNIPRETLLELYRDMLRIRRVEETIESQYHEDRMKTPVHLYIGQEAISAGVCAHLRDDDPIFTTYRSHGQYLSKGGDLKRMIAELHCKETGCSKGRGGSMHLIDLSVGHFGSSAIVGGCLPIATGMAFAQQARGADAVTVTFFGDGATDEGIFYESVNYAMLKKLPIVFVLENNEWAVCSHVSSRKLGENLFHRADPGHLYSAKVDGNAVLEVYEEAGRAIAHARDGKGPAFLECLTYRMRGHAGSGSDAHLGYRSPQEIEAWEKRCPILKYRTWLLKEEVETSAELERMDAEIETEIENAFAFATASPLPKGEDLLLQIYGE
ncbi:MAG: thiamine pyrophosphate-dependent dehydrogenase E1 component subunit alpha [Candidatus Hydrogenedentes bacterium]|nr:thiamine pyrophosphate-dependent dehydrogenase E1 component subunit alpha [Candidatus Hydrogenedentota bacterium]